jgi:N-hydroxyarylamine O-acetyltransferase
MNAEKYLARIGLENPVAIADIYYLKLLQRQHLLNVPFENLDIYWKRPIVLNTVAFYRKIVEENRGGFCYELNGLFNELLAASGFETRLLSACVSDGKGGFSDEYDHLAILVIIGEMQYVADVGFGDFAAEPLQFTPGIEQQDDTGTYMIRPLAAEYFEVAKMNGDEWKSEYKFKPFGHDLSEFTGMCEFHQTSPMSHFTKGKLCSLMTLDGRKTLTDSKFIVTVNGEKTEIPVDSEDGFNELLFREFGIQRPTPIVRQDEFSPVF